MSARGGAPPLCAECRCRIGQRPRLFDALMGQVGLELVFRSSLRDSELLAEHLQIRRTSIAALPDLSCWVSGGITLQRGGNFLMKTHWELIN